MKNALGLVVMLTLCLGLIHAAEQDRTVIAAGRGHPWINLLDGRELSSGLELRARVGEAIPTALASADLDRDGLHDLVIAYAAGEEGWLTIKRANLDARDPSGPGARRRKAEGTFIGYPFLPGSRFRELPVAVDLIGSGDFDKDGREDIVVARLGSTEAYWLPGVGDGELGPPRRIPFRGAITALVAGDIDRGDGRDDIVVGTVSDERSELLLMRQKDDKSFEEFVLLTGESEFDSLAMGRLDRGESIDLATAAGDRATILLGDDSGRFESGTAFHETFATKVRSLAIGDFEDGSSYGPGLAVLRSDGGLQVLRVVDGPEGNGIRPFLLDRAPSGSGQYQELTALNLSNQPGDDLLLRNPADRRLLVRVGGLPRGEWIELESTAAPLATLPMHLNADPFADIVVMMEDSQAPSLLITAASQIHAVDSTDDDSDATVADGICATISESCTLRAAIEQANAAGGTDAISFDIPGSGPHTIQPLSPLPAITDTLLLDATTEPDYAGMPVVELDGSLAGESDGLQIHAGSSSVRGLAVNRFAWSGVVVFGSEAIDNRIQASYIGTDVTGATAQGNLGNGVYIDGGARGTIVGTDGDGVADSDEGNLISDNGGNGVAILSAETEDNVIAGNLIGTDVGGTEALGNAEFGVALFASTHGNIVGTDGDGLSDVEERNLLSGNGVRGVLIAMDAEQNVVAGNYIGTDISGAAALPNAGGGVEVANGARFNLIGTDADGLADDLERNVISGNSQSGIVMFGEPIVEGNTIAGNYIGIDAGGNTALGNEYDGISASDVLNTQVGGSVPEARNVISGNGGSGISIGGDVATATSIQGNYIGTDSTGSLSLGNGYSGITIGDTAAHVVGTDGDGINDDAEGNVTSGNGYAGILVFGAGSTNNVIAGNYIGTDITGVSALPNLSPGIELSNGPSFNRIGTDNDGQSDILERNVISGNGSFGISLFGTPSTDDNLIAGNYIGVQADGASPLGNTLHGILINTAANRNIIGGLGVSPGGCDGPCNIIAYNGTGASIDGVRIVDGTENAVVGNVIHNNVGGTGIDIATAGTTPNDHGDADGGSNNSQNFPMLSLATTAGDTTTIDGILDSLSNTVFHLEFFANSACDGSGYGQGEILIGIDTVTTDVDGMAVFSIPVSPAVPAGYKVSATATRLAPGDIPTDTSEFSPCLGLGPAVAAGRVPDSDSVPGTRMGMVKDGEVNIIFTWDPSCVATDVDYAIYTGTLGDSTSHYPRICSTGGLTTISLRLNETYNYNYFFVVPLSENREGSYGMDSDYVQRPAGAAVCHEQLIEECP
jgi:hypothetical protein